MYKVLFRKILRLLSNINCYINDKLFSMAAKTLEICVKSEISCQTIPLDSASDGCT